MYQIKSGLKVRGPFSKEVILKGIEEGKIEKSDLISFDGENEWERLDASDDFRSVFESSRQKKHTFKNQPPLGNEKTVQIGKLVSKYWILISLFFFGLFVLTFSFIWKSQSGSINQDELEKGKLNQVNLGGQSSRLQVNFESAAIQKWNVVDSVVKNNSTYHESALVIKLSIKNTDANKKVSVRGAINSSRLVDDLGNELKPKFPNRESLSWAEQLNPNLETIINGGQNAFDCLIFELPEKNAKELTLSIGKSIYGAQEDFVFHIFCENLKGSNKGTNLAENGNEKYDLGPGLGLLIQNYDLIESALRKGDARACEQVITKLSDEKKTVAKSMLFSRSMISNQTVQGTALNVLGLVIKENDPVPEVFAGLIKNENPIIRQGAYKVLQKAEIIPEKKFELAKNAIKDKDERIVIFGINDFASMQQKNRKESLTELFNLIQNPSPKIRNQAELIVTTIFKPMNVSDLPALLEVKKIKNIFVLSTLAKVLGQFDQPNQEVIQTLLDLAENQEQLVTAEAIKSLGGFGQRAEESVSKLIGLKQNISPEIRKQAFLALGKISTNPEVLSAIIDGIGDSDHEVSQVCFGLIKKLSKNQVKFDIKAIDNKFESPNGAIREEAFRLLSENGGRISNKLDYEKIAIVGLDDKSELIQKYSLIFLKEIKTLSADGYKKIASYVGVHANTVDEQNIIPICLDILKEGKDLSKDVIPTLEKMLTINQKQKIREHIYSLIEAIGPDASPLVNELFNNVVVPSIPKAQPMSSNLENQKSTNTVSINNLATYRRIFLESGENERIRKTMSFLGKPGAKEIGRYLTSQDPGMRFFALISIQSLGREATNQSALVYKLTVGINEKVPFVLQQARETYGAIK